MGSRGRNLLIHSSSVRCVDHPFGRMLMEFGFCCRCCCCRPHPTSAIQRSRPTTKTRSRPQRRETKRLKKAKNSKTETLISSESPDPTIRKQNRRREAWKTKIKPPRVVEDRKCVCEATGSRVFMFVDPRRHRTVERQFKLTLALSLSPFMLLYGINIILNSIMLRTLKQLTLRA